MQRFNTYVSVHVDTTFADPEGNGLQQRMLVVKGNLRGLGGQTQCLG